MARNRPAVNEGFLLSFIILHFVEAGSELEDLYREDERGCWVPKMPNG